MLQLYLGCPDRGRGGSSLSPPACMAPAGHLISGAWLDLLVWPPCLQSSSSTRILTSHLTCFRCLAASWDLVSLVTGCLVKTVAVTLCQPSLACPLSWPAASVLCQLSPTTSGSPTQPRLVILSLRVAPSQQSVFRITTNYSQPASKIQINNSELGSKINIDFFSQLY